ncbi:BatD family protein [soil metagenome]
MRVLIALLVLLLAAPALAQQPVVVRTSVKPETGAVIGQRVAVFVDVLFAGEMLRPPRVVLPEIAGAQILRFETQATTMSDRIDGTPYTGQRFEFALYARRGGTLGVPAPQVTLLDRAGNDIGTVSGTPASVAIAVPPGVDATQPVIATTRATLDEHWSRAPASALKAGDALIRTVTREADDVPAMAIPALTFPAPEGVRVYADPPQSDDRQNRGAVTGRRIDKVTYVFEAGGRFALPGIVQPWWDLGARRLREEQKPAVTVSVTAPPKPPDPWLFFGPVLGLLALLLADRWLEPRIRAWHDARHARWLASESKAFDDLAHGCGHDDVRAIYRAFTVWRQRSPRRDLAPFAEELESVLFAGAAWPAGRGRSFLLALQAPRNPQRPIDSALPPLNPLTT